MTTPVGRMSKVRMGRMFLPLCCVVLATIVSGASAADPAVTPIREVPLPAVLGPSVPAQDLSFPTTPPPNPEVGDSWYWWLFIHTGGMPHFEQQLCTVRGKSARGYVIVQDAQWGVRVFQDDVDQILERWENTTIGPYPDQGIYEIDSTAFGVPPDELDEDPRIYVLYFNFGNTSDGFFFWFDEYLDGVYPQYHSNECEVLYMNSNNGQDPSGDYMLSVIAHEFEHMIHWKYDGNEDSWVNEGIAELAMWFYGRPDQISVFNTNADNPLIDWNNNWADYIKTYLWSLYFFERYGGHPSIYAVVHQPLNSIAGYEAVLDAFGYTQSVADVFADWAVANFLDDPSIGDGRFGYVGDELPAFLVMGTYTTYPVPDQNKTVGHWATDYYRFQNFTDLTSLRINFDGSDNNVFAVWGLALHADGATDVLRMAVDGPTQSGTLDVSGLDDPSDQVILVVAGVSSVGTTSYRFNASESPASVPDLAGGTFVGRMGLKLEASPNPARGETTLRVSWEAPLTAPELRVDLFDAQGRRVHALSAVAPAVNGLGGQLTLTWDGCLSDGHRADPGIYYARARAGALGSECRILQMP